MQFEYYYGVEADSFNYIPVPKILMTDPQFKRLSAEAVLLYSIMLNRMSLSRKNEWFDDENRVYIIFTLEEIIETIGRAHTKCVNILKELECVGLIERKKRGLGKPDIIYVKDFIHEKKEPANPDKITDFSNRELKTSQNENSGLHETGIQDFSNRETIKKDINNTNINKTDMNYINTPPLLPCERTEDAIPAHEVPLVDDDEEEKTNSCNLVLNEELIKNNIQYDRLIRRHSGNKKLLAFILSQMVAMASESKETIELSSGCFRSKLEVLERLSHITYDDIENLLHDLPDQDECNVKNPKGYIRKCLYNIDDRRGAICSTQQIKRKANNNQYANYHQTEYDWDEINRMVGL